MGNQLISFRLTPIEIALLESVAREGEGHSATASRLLREKLGYQLPGEKEPITITAIESMLEDMITERMASINEAIKQTVESKVKSELEPILAKLETLEAAQNQPKKGRPKKTTIGNSPDSDIKSLP